MTCIMWSNVIWWLLALVIYVHISLNTLFIWLKCSKTYKIRGYSNNILVCVFEKLRKMFHMGIVIMWFWFLNWLRKVIVKTYIFDTWYFDFSVLYMGCYIDARNRDLPEEQPESEERTVQECGALCIEQGNMQPTVNHEKTWGNNDSVSGSALQRGGRGRGNLWTLLVHTAFILPRRQRSDIFTEVVCSPQDSR